MCNNCDGLENPVLEKVADSIRKTFELLKLDLNDPNLKDTPGRIAKMYMNETLGGLYKKEPKITVFPNEWEEKYEWMVIVEDIEVHSLCSHHWQNFDGKCTIAYIPGKSVIWLSKFSRVVDFYARRPQLQERLTKQIFNHLKKVLDTDNIAITMNCVHNCMMVRWVREHNASTTTSLMGWLFMHSEATRIEFLNRIKKW